VTGLDAHAVYEFRVIALNSIGRGLASSPVDVATGELGIRVLFINLYFMGDKGMMEEINE